MRIRGKTPSVGRILRSRGAIAQLGERLLCKQEVTGSIPVGSIQKRPANIHLLVSVQWVAVRASSGAGSPRVWAAMASVRWAYSERLCRRQVVCAESSRATRCSPSLD
jgi:hypothetical protein